jgi:hypothetical protein
MALRDQERRPTRDGILDDLRREAEARERIADFIGQIGVQRGIAPVLTLGAERDAALQIREKRARIECPASDGDRVFAHVLGFFHDVSGKMFIAIPASLGTSKIRDNFNICG